MDDDGDAGDGGYFIGDGGVGAGVGSDNYHHGNGSMGPRLGNSNYLAQAFLWPTRSMTGPFVANVFRAKPCLANAFYDRLSSGQRFLSQAFFWPKLLGFAVRWIVAARVL